MSDLCGVQGVQKVHMIIKKFFYPRTPFLHNFLHQLAVLVLIFLLRKTRHFRVIDNYYWVNARVPIYDSNLFTQISLVYN
jgi:hypothetical protein